jgi:probable H4MPT-linked C1 transfer pathway protein
VSGAIVGWDIGGANVKAARVSGTGRTDVLERPFALWKEPQRLPEVLSAVAASVGPAGRHAVTMTAELADCYASKREGVAAVLDAFESALPNGETHVFGVDGRFRAPSEARAATLVVASANWMATALVAARSHADALLVDVGSTTTDLVPIRGGGVVAEGRTDPERLQFGELVYTGLLRTPVCAIVQELPFRGRPCRIAAEWFAIAADAHVWLGTLGEADYACDTPDGRGRSRRECGARLARMVAADDEMLGGDEITALASAIAAAQAEAVAAGIQQVVSRVGALPYAVGVGQGLALAEAACRSAGLALRPPSDALVARAAPAVAVATLLRDGVRS